MKRTTIATILSLLVALLFSYTAVTKLMDYENFRFGLSESPFIEFMAPVLAWALPAVELLVAVMLLFTRTRMAGLYISFLLLTLFTIYIAAMLAFALDIPCSCGGVLEHMSWPVHIIFNGAFILLTLAAVFLLNRVKKKSLNDLAGNNTKYTPFTIHN